MSTDPSIWGSGAVKEEVLIPGPPGPPPELVQGATSETMGAPQATLTPVGPGKYRIDWVLKTGKEGSKGNTGATGTVASATVEMIPHDQPATVTVSGTPPNQTMHFKLPRQTPTPGVAGPPGKLQNVRGVLPDDQTVIDLYAEGGPPDTVLLNVLKSSETVKVFVSESGVITFKAVGGGPAPEPFKPSQISLLTSSGIPVVGESLVNITFEVSIPELGEAAAVLPVPTNEYVVGDEKFIRAVSLVTVNLEESATELVSIYAAVTINDGFASIPTVAAASIPVGGDGTVIVLTTPILKVSTGDKIKVMAQPSKDVNIQGGSILSIERFY